MSSNSSLENFSSGSNGITRFLRVVIVLLAYYFPPRKVKQYGIHEHKFVKCLKKRELPKKQFS